VRRSLPSLGAALLLLAAALPARAQTGYLAFGDSITEGRGDDPARTEKGYPPRLQALLVDAGVQATVQNEGEGGESTADGLTRLDGVLAGISNATDVMILMEGTNDLKNGISVETTRRNLTDMARKAQQKGLTVVHATLIPRLPTAPMDGENIVNLTIAENIRDMAGRNTRTLADPFEVFSTLPNLFATYYSAERPDPVGHPNAAGYDKLAQLFFDVLRNRDTVPPVPGITVPLHGAEAVPASGPIQVEVWDFATGIDLANTRLLVNGADTGVVPTGDAKHATLTYTPAQPLSGVLRVGLRSRDLATPTPNSFDREVARALIAGTVVLDGDLDRDGRVDGEDLVQFGRRFGARKGELLYLDRADFNVDQIIDGTDLARLASNFGRTSF
jgi:lysophospholipase L1-like esterase